jgi:glycosyltransferase involved in cell wall biosynthesis
MSRFSVVVPTRDRPDLLEFCLESLAAQTFDDAEVVVSDNPTHSPARDVFERWAGPGWRYVRPEQAVPMHENFERGCAEASGDYVAVVIDKTVLHPSALAVADHALQVEPSAEIVTWWNEGYDPVDEAHNLAGGRFHPTARTVSPTLYDPAAALSARFANAKRRGAELVHYFRGKIVFGAFAQTLLDRIRDQTGRVFYPLAPDYTSMVPACVLAKGAIDVGRPLLLSYNSARSNGRMQSIDPAHARRFIEAADPAIIDALPIPGLYASHHNVVAYDLVSAAERCPSGTTPPLDLANLSRRAREDLGFVVWSDPEERDAQYRILEATESTLGVEPAVAAPREAGSLRASVAELIARVPPIARATYWAAGRADESPRTYGSPLEAAGAADRYYTARSDGT